MTPAHAGALGPRLARWLAWLTLSGLALTCLGVYTATALSFDDRQRDTLRQKQAQLQHLLVEAAPTNGVALQHRLGDVLIGRQDLAVLIADAGGQVLFASPKLPAAHRQLVDAAEVSTVTGPLHITLSLAVEDDDRVLARLARTLAAAALAGASAIAIGGWWLVRRSLRPVRQLVAQVQGLAADTLDRRLDGSAQPAELAPLVAHANALLARLDQAYAQLESFNADVAHELFTPLATLMSGTELALRKARDTQALRDVLADQQEELQRMAMIVQDMLFLSQADRGARARLAQVPSLAGLATAVAELHEAALEEAGLRWRVDGDASCEADTRLLQRALSNLIGNATRHARRGGEVTVEIRKQGQQVGMCVINWGDTIPEAHVPRLFDRFYRVDGSRGDTAQHHGLGLAIVAAVARMHGGRTRAGSCDGLTSIGFDWPAKGPDPINDPLVQPSQVGASRPGPAA